MQGENEGKGRKSEDGGQFRVKSLDSEAQAAWGEF